jgi:hypothetical protein
VSVRDVTSLLEIRGGTTLDIFKLFLALSTLTKLRLTAHFGPKIFLGFSLSKESSLGTLSNFNILAVGGSRGVRRFRAMDGGTTA